MLITATVCVACALNDWNVEAHETGEAQSDASFESADPLSNLDVRIERLRQSDIDEAVQETLVDDLPHAREEVEAIKNASGETNESVQVSQQSIDEREAIIQDLVRQLRQTRTRAQEAAESQRKAERELKQLQFFKEKEAEEKPRAEETREEHVVSLDEIKSRGRTPPTVLPPTVPNPDPRIFESMTIASNVLHGFSSSELERSATARLAALVGAESPSKHVSVAGFGEYRIGATDVVDFISLDNPALNGTLTVRYDGQLSLPLIPDIKVAGLTRAEAEELIRMAYAKSIRDPEISLAVTYPNSKIFTMIGDVERPGIYNYTREISLNQSLSLAGGRAQRTFGEGTSQFISVAGQITKAFVVRTIDGERKVFAYDLRNIDQPGSHDGDAPIYYGDLVYVPQGVNLVYLLGEQTAPRIVEMTDGLTLLQMLALSGGFNESVSRLKEVVLLRAVDDEHTDIHLINLRSILKAETQDIRLVAGDVIYIPRKRLVRLQEFVIRFTSTISAVLGLYEQAVDTYFTYDINKQLLDLLRNQNSGVGVTPNVAPFRQLPQPLQ